METQNKIKSLETCLVLVLALILAFWVYDLNWCLYLALVIAAIGLFVPPIANAIRWAWYKLAEGLGAITSRILLAIIFFLLLTPIAFLYRFFQRKKWVSYDSQSAWITRNHTFQKEDLENPW